MSGTPFNATRRAALLSGSMLVLGSVLAGCGFSPVYGQRGTAGGVEEDLAAVEIGYFEDREGQQLRNFLLDRFNPRGRVSNTAYGLSGTIEISSANLGTQLDATTTRSQVTVFVQTNLRAFGDTYEFNSRGVASYATSESDYASSVARAAAVERSLLVIADDLRLQIATFFEKQRRLRG